MAIDPRLSLAVRGPDIGGSVASGLATGERLGSSSVRKQLLEQQAAAGEVSIEQAQQQQAMQGMQNFADTISGLANVPLADRAKILAQRAPMLKAAGIPIEHLTSMDLTDAGIKNQAASIKPFMSKLQQQAAAPAAVQSFDYFQQVLASPDTSADQKKAARIELKLDSPAPTDYQSSMLDIKKEGAELKRLQVKEAKETNELKKQKLQADIGAQQTKLEAKNKATIETAERDLATFDSTLEVVSQLTNHKGLDAAVGGTSFFPTMPGSNAADFEAKLEQLKGKQFLTEIQKMKGMGALSENEGKKLAAAASALDLSMSEDAFKKELEYITNTMTVARKKIAGKLPVKQEQQTATELSDDDLMNSLGL